MAPFASDSAIIDGVLGRAGLRIELAKSPDDLAAKVHAGAGAALLTEEALTPAGLQELTNLLAQQPSWSDLPVLLLLTEAAPIRTEAARFGGFLSATPSLTVLRRPIPSVTLVTAVQSALRARRRQYEVRDLIVQERIAREQAEAATRIKDEFLANVSHELRTPLNAILLWSKLLVSGRLDEERARNALHVIVSSAETQSRLIEDLLDIARMLTGRLRLDVGAHPLAPVVLAAVEVVRPMADVKGVVLDLRLDPTGAVVKGDPQRIQQIFWNILTNAVKFTAGGGVVSVRLLRADHWLEVSVTDTGEGIEPGFLPHVFERFGQGSRHGSGLDREAQVGLGLGLSIVRQLVELHGGTVTASSAGKGQGSTFRVRLPAAAV
jgi:signal transduction histidine kinase